MNIQADDSDEVSRRLSEKNGDKPCFHSRLIKEYFKGASTGDFICADCGKIGYGSDWPDKNQ
ncbi:hypothetical protein Q9R46_16180 [Paenibacillus sp. RRE4]|uniref:Uncharacterized protein n=1 Tax=Paenibacillus silvae TaxID=1325358 RepID=A0ABQ1Z1Q6_9BACL|nr:MULTISPECIES: hypothetical protein [Paenibacillus]MDT0124198.1 hypothetical protein [Paenibacillus sp. RRE4]GGH46482.1 hypothetical protein GCM10008014_09170 [Paenibacillus silvae]